MSMYYMPELWESIEAVVDRRDPFARIARASEAYREKKRSDTYPSTLDAPLIATIAAAIKARRILEVGCGLGYSALWLAHGAGPEAIVETIEKHPEQRELALSHFKSEGYEKQIKILAGHSTEVMERLEGPYDLIFVDGDIGSYHDDLGHFARLLRSGGVLASANLFLDEVHPDLPGAKNLTRYRKQLFIDKAWFTSVLPLTVGLAISVRRAGKT